MLLMGQRVIGKHTATGDKEQMVPLAEVQAQTDQIQAKGVQTATNKRRMVRPAYLSDFRIVQEHCVQDGRFDAGF